MRISRLNYDKCHRCPTWSGPAWVDSSWEGYCDASFAAFMYDRRMWAWRFTRCRQCGVLCLPYKTRWLDPAWLGWRFGREYRRIYGRTG